MAVNSERGEVGLPAAAAAALDTVAIKLADHVWKMRPTFEAMVEIERETKTKIVPLAQAIAVNNYGILDISIIVAAGLKGAGERSVTLEKVGRMIERVGLLDPDLIQSVTDFMKMCLTGGKEPGEAKAVAETPQATSSPTAGISDTP